jgi:hypothetical protein
MRRSSRPLALAALAAAAAVTLPARPARAQPAAQPAAPSTAPDGTARLVGEWVLDTARSTRGPAMPARLTMHVRREGGALVVRRVAATPAGPPLDVTFTYALDGSPSVNRTNQGGAELVVTTTAARAGAALTLDSQIQTPTQVVHQVDQLTVAPDGSELTVARTMIAGERQMNLTFVFRKKAG